VSGFRQELRCVCDRRFVVAFSEEELAAAEQVALDAGADPFLVGERLGADLALEVEFGLRRCARCRRKAARKR
jgi:hypothetical protein